VAPAPPPVQTQHNPYATSSALSWATATVNAVPTVLPTSPFRTDATAAAPFWTGAPATSVGTPAPLSPLASVQAVATTTVARDLKTASTETVLDEFGRLQINDAITTMTRMRQEQSAEQRRRQEEQACWQRPMSTRPG